MLRAMVLIALCAVAWPSSAFAVDDAPHQTGAFVAYCKTNSEGCTNKMTEMYAAMLILGTVQPGKWCQTKESNDINVLTPKVIGWLTAHPEANSKTTNDGIETAIIQIYPCKH